MVNESVIKEIITKQKKGLEPGEFKKYLKDTNKLFGTNFKIEDFA